MYNETTDIKILRRKIKNEYLIKRNISKKCFYENRNISCRWYQSEDYTRISNYCEENITLIYRDKILEQYHVETDQITEDDLEENNNINFVITKMTQLIWNHVAIMMLIMMHMIIMMIIIN